MECNGYPTKPRSVTIPIPSNSPIYQWRNEPKDAYCLIRFQHEAAESKHLPPDTGPQYARTRY
eukprot:6473103-Amphidinium_carterae.1